MDRSARSRARGRRGETQAEASSSRARGRRGKGAVVIDLGDEDDECGGGAAPAAAPVGRRSRSSAEAPSVPPAPAGSVAMRTRSRRLATQAPLAAAEEEAPRTKRRRKEGTSEEAVGGRRSKGSVGSRSTSRGKRCASSRRTSKPLNRALARKSKEAEAEDEAEAETRADGREDSGQGDGTSDDDNVEFHTAEAGGIAQGRSAAGGDGIHEHCGSESVSVLNPSHAMNAVAPGNALEVEGCLDEGGELGRGFVADEENVNEEDTEDFGNMDSLPVENMMTEGIEPCEDDYAPFEDDYDDEILEEQLVGDIIRAYSNGGNLDENGPDWEVEDELEFDDDGDLMPDSGNLDANGPDWEIEDEVEFDDDADVMPDSGNLDANGLDWEIEDELEFHDDGDDDYFVHDADECVMPEPMHENAKAEMQDFEVQKVVADKARCHEEEDVVRNEEETKGGGAMVSNQGSLHIEILDSDEEVKVVSNASNVLKRKPSSQAKAAIVPCVAWRTRSAWGLKQDRISYNAYFQDLSDEDEPKEEDDTEVELEEEEDDNDDDDSSSSCDEEEEEEQKEVEAESRAHKKGISSSDDEIIDDAVRKCKKSIDSSDGEIIDDTVRRAKKRTESSNDEIIDDTVKCGAKWEGGEDRQDYTIQPLNLKNNGTPYSSRYGPKFGSEVPVDRHTITQQQKQSRFTWDLERRKMLKLGMKSRRLYERDLDSDSNSSGSDENRRDGSQGGCDNKVGRKKKHLSSKSGKRSSRSSIMKRQSLLKLLMDKMCSDKDKELFPFDQHLQFDYNLKDLPLVFSFGDEGSTPADRTEQNDTLDMLWADFDFALESENIGTYYDDEHQEGNNLLNLGLAPITPCSQGKHEFIIDEQIGIRCKYCSLVNLEIKYVLPSMASNFAEKSAWQYAPSFKDALMYLDLCEQAGTVDGQSQGSHLYGTVWDLIPGAITTMYQHQREAIEFMWTNLVGDIRLDELKHGAKPDVVGGCVICHAPGTGKTRLAIVFIQTYMKVFPDCRPVIIAPRGMLFAWEEEFKKWDVNVPFHIMNTADYSGKEDRDICRLIKKEHRTDKLTRLVKLLSWNKGHGVLGISYGLYMKLTSEKSSCSEENKVRSILLDNPGLLVLDEGHTPRNARSVMWKTLGKVKTEKRIILSGTPFQNNFLELYNILCLVRPRFGEMFLTKSKVGRRHYVSKKKQDKVSDKYEKGVWASITSNVTDDNAEKVRSILKPFVHIHNGNILRTLPGLRECVIILKPPPLQKSIIRKVENIGSGNNFEHEYVISLASTHPSLVTAINMSDEEAALVDKPMLERLRSNPYEGVKTRFVIEVVRLCEALKEKVLIFSQFIQPLELIKEHLRKFFKWREGKEILQMDGKILPRLRQNSIEVFNNPDSDARVLLASTRACCEGISLTGASRVVLLDVVWNPAVGRQAISRAFRIGQKKFVYTYNLITYGTGEGDKFDRQAEKDHLSKLVFSAEDEFNNVRNMLSKAEMEHCSKLISEDKVLEEMASHDQLKGMFLKIHYPPTESNMVFTYNQMSAELS